ncbi:MAG: hypothetical protein ACK553_01670 [Planctomycetota bacterium]
MRASRQTELQREFPLHVVCSWLGNSPRIAQQSHLLVTEDDFAKAAGELGRPNECSSDDNRNQRAFATRSPSRRGFIPVGKPRGGGVA